MISRRAVVTEACSRLGEGARAGYAGQWCGQHVLDVLHAVGCAQDIAWIFGRGFVLQNANAFPAVARPEPGDIGVQTHAPWHHLQCVARDGDTIYTVGGNEGPSPGAVKTGAHSLTDPGWAWYSIEPVLAIP